MLDYGHKFALWAVSTVNDGPGLTVFYLSLAYLSCYTSLLGIGRLHADVPRTKIKYEELHRIFPFAQALASMFVFSFYMAQAMKPDEIAHGYSFSGVMVATFMVQWCIRRLLEVSGLARRGGSSITFPIEDITKWIGWLPGDTNNLTQLKARFEGIVEAELPRKQSEAGKHTAH